MIHLNGEQREPRTRETPHDGIGRDPAVRVHQVAVDNIVDPLHEDHENAGPDRDAREHLRDPGDVRAARPREPEEADWQQRAADNHRRQTFFWHGLPAVGGQLLGVPRLGVVDDEAGANDDADGDGEEGEGAEAGGPAAQLLEADRVGFEEEVDDAVDEGYVYCYEQQDRLEEEHLNGLQNVLGEDVGRAHADSVELGVEGPVFGFMTKLLCTALEQDGTIGFGNDEDGDGEEEYGHYECDVLGPAPAEMGLDDEAANDGAGDGADECGACEQGDGDTSIDG